MCPQIFFKQSKTNIVARYKTTISKVKTPNRTFSKETIPIEKYYNKMLTSKLFY